MVSGDIPWFKKDLVGKPLLVNQRVERLLDVHVVIDDVDDRLQNCGDDPRPPRAPSANHGVPSLRITIVGVIDESGRFMGWTRLCSSLHKSVEIRLARPRCKVIHFIVQENARSLDRDARSVQVIDCVGVRDDIPGRIHYRVMRRFHSFFRGDFTVVNICAMVALYSARSRLPDASRTLCRLAATPEHQRNRDPP